MKAKLIIVVLLSITCFACFDMVENGKPPVMVRMAFNHNTANSPYDNHFSYVLKENGKVIEEADKPMFSGDADYMPLNGLVAGHCYEIEINVRKQVRPPLTFCPPVGTSYISADADGSNLVFYH